MWKYTIQDCKEWAIAKGGKCLDDVYINKHSLMSWMCAQEHVWRATFHTIMNHNAWCLKCSGKAAYTLQDCHDFAVTKGWTCLATEYPGKDIKMPWLCDKGHRIMVRFGSLVLGKGGCVYCAGTSKYTLQDCCDFACSKKGKCLADEYAHNYTSMPWQCEYGHVWWNSFKKIKQGQWCPYCVRQISKAQIDIYERLCAIFPQLNIVLNDEATIKPYDLDIYIPELRLAIEYDGEYWHYSEWAIKTGAVERMNTKNSLCVNNSITLIRVREKHWLRDDEHELQQLVSAIKIVADSFGEICQKAA